MIKYYLKQIREQKSLTKKQLERISGVSDTHISAIENGERGMSVEVLFALAKALNVDINELAKYEKR